MARRISRLVFPVLLIAVLLGGGSAIAQGGVGSLLTGADFQSTDIEPTGGMQLSAVSAHISYQGLLTNAGGAPLDGNFDIAVEIWNAPTGGDLLWEYTFEDHSVVDGLLDLVLWVNPDDFNGQALWLAIAVDGQDVGPMQEILPAPYALSLRPGAMIEGDAEYGLSSRTSGKYGLFGKSTLDGDSAGVYGLNQGGVGFGIAGISDGAAGAFGRGMGEDSYGGYFVSDLGRGLLASGADDWTVDVELGGTAEEDDGVLSSSMAFPESDLVLVSNDLCVVVLDENNDDENSEFWIMNGDDEIVFSVDEEGSVRSRGEVFDMHPLDTAGQWVVEVPAFCIDGLCEVLVYQDGTIGAFGPGMFLPVQVSQRSDDGGWLGGPNLAFAGVSYSDGNGTNGDGVTQYIFGGGETSGGGYVRVLDDSAAENDAGLWTIEFNPVAGELEQAIVYIGPMGTPIQPVWGGE